MFFWFPDSRRRLILSLAGVLLLFPLLAAAELSRGFLQELGGIGTPGSLYVDVINSTGEHVPLAASELRVVLPKSELLISETSLGYKGWLIAPALTGYVKISSGTNPSTTGARLGTAYLLSSPYLKINLNPELERMDNENYINLNGAVYLPVAVPRWLGRIDLAGEVLSSEKLTGGPALALGARWRLRRQLTVDIMIGGDGGSTQRATLRTPAALRVNLRL